jgi:hypothetical protein
MSLMSIDLSPQPDVAATEEDGYGGRQVPARELDWSDPEIGVGSIFSFLPRAEAPALAETEIRPDPISRHFAFSPIFRV